MSRIAVMSHPVHHKMFTKKQKKPTPLIALSALLGGAAIIGTIPIFVRLSELGPTTTGFWRLGLALPVLWMWLTLDHQDKAASHQPAKGREYLWLVGGGVFLAGDLALFNQALELTSVTNAALLINMAPIFIVLGARVLFGERIKPIFIIGLAVALAGAIILVGSTLTFGLNSLFGDMLALLSAVVTAGYTLSMKRVRASFSVSVGLSWSGTVTAIVLLVLATLFGEDLIPASLEAWLPLLGLALISHLGGQGLITYSLAHLPASLASICFLLQPVVATVLAWVILQESLGLWQAVGGAVVLFGICLAQRGRKSA